MNVVWRFTDDNNSFRSFRRRFELTANWLEDDVRVKDGKILKREGTKSKKKVEKRRHKNIVRSATSHALGFPRARQTRGPRVRIARFKSRTTLSGIYDGRSQEKRKILMATSWNVFLDGINVDFCLKSITLPSAVRKFFLKITNLSF